MALAETAIFEKLWLEVLNLEKVTDDTNFFSNGGDSLLAVRLLSRCRENGMTLHAKDLYQYQTFGVLKGKIEWQYELRPSTQEHQRNHSYRHHLLPSQARWTQSTTVNVNHFNLGWLMYCPPEVTTEILEKAVHLVCERQEALRTAYIYQDHHEQWIAEVQEVDVKKILLSAKYTDYRTRIDDMIEECQQAHESMNIEEGIVFRVLHFPFQGEPGRLLILVHHLSLDGFSVSLLADEMEQALLQVMGHYNFQLSEINPPRSYAKAIQEWVQTMEAVEVAKQWLSMEWSKLSSFPTEKSGDGTVASMQIEIGSLSKETTQRLTTRAKKLGVGVDEITISAGIGAISEWSGIPFLGVDVYKFGRDETPQGIDMARTIAYIVNKYPVLLRWLGISEQGSWFEQMAPQFAQVPRPYYGFDALRYYQNPYQKEMQALPHVPIKFNFRGRYYGVIERNGRWLKPAPEPMGQYRNLDQTEAHLLMYEADIINGELIILLKYSIDFYNETTVNLLMRRTIELLEHEANQREEKK